MRTLNFKVTRSTESNVWITNGNRSITFPRGQVESWTESSVTFYNPKKAMQALNMLSISDKEKAQVFEAAKKACVSCEGTGRIYWGDSEYGCAHGLSLEQRTFDGKIH